MSAAEVIYIDVQPPEDTSRSSNAAPEKEPAPPSKTSKKSGRPGFWTPEEREQKIREAAVLRPALFRKHKAEYELKIQHIYDDHAIEIQKIHDAHAAELVARETKYAELKAQLSETMKSLSFFAALCREKLDTSPS